MTPVTMRTRSRVWRAKRRSTSKRVSAGRGESPFSRSRSSACGVGGRHHLAPALRQRHGADAAGA